MPNKTVREKIEDWVKENPNAYLEKGLNAIADEIDISASSVSKILPLIIAERDNILPSEVVKKREARGFKMRSNRERLDKEKIKEIKHQHELGIEIRDIGYILDIHPDTVRKYLKSVG